MDKDLEQTVHAVCPRCQEVKVFSRVKSPMSPCQLYSCRECNISVSVFYIRNKSYQKVYLKDGKHS